MHDLQTKPLPKVASRLQAVLVVGDEVRDVELPADGEVIIGRGRGADICVEHPTMSREHAALRVTPTLAIKDLGGTNGTSVRNQRLVCGEWAELALGDAVHLGDVVLMLRRQSDLPTLLEQPRRFERFEPNLAQVAAGTITVLILGETGSGKEICAETIHRLSPRADRTLLRLNCAALPEALLEGELFGHERGAFTGAVSVKPGLLESAEGGSVFLDEIGELPPAVQVKLLRVLDTREVMRLGGLTPRVIDVRFIAATHRDLRAEVQASRFREDLYYRLSAVTVRVPPLRDRADEIPSLAAEFAEEAAQDLGHAPPPLSSEALAALLHYTWPGNIRELRNVITRAVLLASGGVIQRRHLHLDVDAGDRRPAAAPTSPPSRPRSHANTAPVAPVTDPPTAATTLSDAMREVERARILETLERYGGNQTRAARELGIARGTLVARLTAYGVIRPRKS